MRLGFLCSHKGRNMQSVVAGCRDGRLPAEPVVVVSNNSDSAALAFARQKGISAYHLSSVTHPDADDLDLAICETFRQEDVDLVLLVGYNKLLGKRTLETFAGRILNTHPAPLPEFGGKGMYGMNVHEAVLASGLAMTAVSIHLVDGEYDHGRVIAANSVEILPGDTPESLAERVRAHEAEFLLQTLQRISQGEIVLETAKR